MTMNIKLKCFYGDNIPGDVIDVEADEAARLKDSGAADDAPASDQAIAADVKAGAARADDGKAGKTK